jgi:hypothetical protein
MTLTRVAALSALLFCCAGPAGAQNVKLEFRDGKVSLTAQNASLRAILTEWARLGGTQVVNIERLAGAPVTLQLTDVPETQALDIILRGTAGYIAGQRAAAGPAEARSTLDRILVVPTAGTAATASARPAATPPPFGGPQRFVQPDPDDNAVADVADDDGPQNRAIRMNVPPNVPIQIQRGQPNQTAPPQPFQTTQDDNQTPQPETTQAPANPFGIQTGSSRPGTITPVPPQGPKKQPDSEP